MSSRAGYTGFAVTGVDAKSRASIPAGLRSPLEKNAAEQRVVIALHPSAPCLIGFDPAFLDIQAAKLELRADARLDAGDAVDPNIARMALTMTETVSYDSSGRFVLPPFFAMKGRLEKNAPAFFAGVGSHFEIWNLDVLDAEASVAAPIKEAARFLRDQWSAK